MAPVKLICLSVRFCDCYFGRSSLRWYRMLHQFFEIFENLSSRYSFRNEIFFGYLIIYSWIQTVIVENYIVEDFNIVVWCWNFYDMQILRFNFEITKIRIYIEFCLLMVEMLLCLLASWCLFSFRRVIIQTRDRFCLKTIGFRSN